MCKFVRLFLVLAFALLPNPALALDVGEAAPDFQGISTQGQLNLAGYQGKVNVILALYFAAFTPV